MKGWLYVISNRAVPRLVKVGTTAKDPHSYAESLDKGGLPFPHEVGYEALVPDMDRAGKAAEEALAAKAEGKGWYSCSIAEAVRTVAEAAGRSVLLENRYDPQSRADKIYGEVSSPDPVRRAAVLSDPSCPPNVLRFAVEREDDEAVLLAMLGNPACVGLGEGLADLVPRVSGMPGVLAAVAADPRMPPAVLEAVLTAAGESEDPDGIVLSLVGNPGFPPRLLLTAVVGHPDAEEALRAVAGRADCGPHALAAIVWIREGGDPLADAARRHPNWSDEAFFSRAEIEAGESPSSAAERADCPPALLARLWKSGDWETKEAVLANRSCPQEVLVEASVADDAGDLPEGWAASLAEVAMDNPSNPLVRAGMPAGEDEFLALSRSRFPRVVLRVASNPACPAGVLRPLSGHGDGEVRLAVAGNRSCPSDVLPALAEDPSESVRVAVAAREGCPLELLRALAYDVAPDVAAAALRNPNCPAAVLEDFAGNDLHEWRLLVLENPACPDSVIEILSADRNHAVRTAANKEVSARRRPEKAAQAPVESLETVRERFRGYVRRTMGAIVEESELVRLAALPAEEKESFAREHPDLARQLALFEKHLLPWVRQGGGTERKT